MAEIVFRDLKLQVGDRIKIPKPVIDTLNLKKGQKIILKFDAEKRKILIEEVDKK